MLITITWLITIPAAWGLWLVLSEDAPERVSQRELEQAHEDSQVRDACFRAAMARHRGMDTYDWRIKYLTAKHECYIRKFRILWDGEVA